MGTESTEAVRSRLRNQARSTGLPSCETALVPSPRVTVAALCGYSPGLGIGEEVETVVGLVKSV